MCTDIAIVGKCYIIILVKETTDYKQEAFRRLKRSLKNGVHRRKYNYKLCKKVKF